MTAAEKLAVLRYQLALHGATFVLRTGDNVRVLDPTEIIGTRGDLILVDEIAQRQQFQNNPPQG
ncbi:hypothetical protein C7I87_00595 [Mesorhizobium sp. SARCC-RB16n]|uniref:hypothetical protein n=1 Tax=Mesorhizobium sp. SARCC-RB16n TaxID=2116687 RepID=UPI00122F6156|nr:hypothetical protein [Mesorhizobium sp. SARCC-RB16n]KAA3452711.1 hypothetical protein C7I87_00595 [Mesorhizobium sp. SARCC-RB16n]